MKKHKYNIFPVMSSDEFNRLKEDIRSNGFDGKHPIYLYEGDILDGWNRYLACVDLDILPPYRDFIGNDYEALLFVMRSNKRRNLTSSQWAVIAVEAQEIIDMVEDEVEHQRRKKQAETQKEALKRRKIEKQRLEGVIDDLKEELGAIDENEVDPITELIPEQGQKNRNKESTEIIAEQFNTNNNYIKEASKLKDKDPEKFEAVKRGEITLSSVKKDLKKVHISNNSGEYEWYTPDYIIESARLVMGKIDLDPASSEKANETVKAEFFMTKEKGGLDKTWFGNVWLNPPYAQPLIAQFAEAVVEKRLEYTQALIMVNNATETDWMQKMLSICNAVCLIKGRIKFLDVNGNSGNPLQGQLIIYIGENEIQFHNEFKKYGTCVTVCK